VAEVVIKDEKWGKAEKAILEAAERVLKTSTFAIEAGAKMRAPVDTGFLRSSIQSRFPVPGVGIVSAAAEYAIYVEFGTRYAPGQPFLVPAFEVEQQKFLKALSRIGDSLNL
jgi:HK97 gp10 family phage protein